MDLNSGESSEITRLGFGLALVVLCLGTGFHYALNRVLTRVGASMNGAFLVFDDVDGIVDSLDRLSLNYRFFIRTGDLHFSQDVYESVAVAQKRMDSLRRVAGKDSRLRDSIARLDRAIDWEVALLRKASELDKSKGPADAIALLDKDESIEEARTEAEHLRLLATKGAFDRLRTERKMKWILDVML
jgi:CHASE3 domain sensor protein